MKPTLISSVQALLDKVSSLTGKGFEFREKKDLPVYAALKLARSGMPAHIIYFDPKHDAVINHLVAHECGHALRMWGTPAEQRLVSKFGEKNRRIALYQMEGDILEISQSLSFERLTELINFLYHGLVRQLTSMPPDIMIEYWLYDDFPDLRPYQPMCLLRQQIEAIKGLDFKISRIVPVKIVAASNTMNYCFLRLVGMHMGQNLVSPYDGSVYVKRGKELAEITAREYRNDYLGDIAMTNRWAAFLELQDWFSWTSFEDMPPGYLDTV